MKKLVQVLDKDKRKRKRIELFNNVTAKVEVLGKSVEATIKDISYSGIGVILQSGQGFPMMDSLETKLELSNQLFQGKVANSIVLPNQEIKIGLALPIEATKEIDFNINDSSWDRVTDIETIQNIYQDLVFKGPEAPIEIRQNFSNAIIWPLEIKSSDNLLCEIQMIHQGSFEKGKAKCKFDLFQTCHAFESKIEKISDKYLEIKLSNVLARLLRRQTVRVLETAGNYEIKIVMKSKSLKQEISEFQVYDYSEQGLSLIDPEGELSLPRNLSFEEVYIDIKDIGIIKGRGEVRSYEWKEKQNAYIIGLLFEPSEEPHLTNWHNFILKARYPNLDFEFKVSDHVKIWDLFSRSDYLHLKGKDAYTAIIDLTKNTWIKLKDVGTAFSKRAMIRKDDKILGHIQMDQFYPNTWCVHHLAIDPKMSKLIAGELYALTTDVLLSEKGKYLINFTESSKSWNQRSYYDFIKNYRFPEHNELKEFFIYEAQTNTNNIIRDARFIIRKPNKFDTKKIIKFLSSHLSDLEIQACSLTEEDIDLEKLNKFYNEVGLSRKRDFLACYLDNQLVGIARMEFGSEGVNIVGIQDMLYLYASPNDPNLGHIIDSLMYESIEVYKQEKKEKLIVSLEFERTKEFQNFGINFVCIASRWIALKDILPRYHAFSQLLYGNLILKREKIRVKNKEKSD